VNSKHNIKVSVGQFVRDEWLSNRVTWK